MWMFDPLTEPSHVTATCCHVLTWTAAVETRDGEIVGNVSTAKRIPVAPFIARNQPPLLLSLSIMRPPLPPPAERGFTQTETLMPCANRLARLPAPEADM